MLLYHGSNVGVKNPIIIKSKRVLDFGDGFYLTTDLEQAKKWALLVARRRNCGIPTVSVFEYNEENDLNILKFKIPDKEWLKYVTNNRKKLINDDANNDIIIGPVANDNTMPVISLYLSGILDEEETLKRLLPQKLKDQFVFKTSFSLKKLEFKEMKIYENERYYE